MSGLETGRYEYSNLACRSRDEGDEGPHNPYKLRLCLHFLCRPPLPVSLAGNLCFATSYRDECLKGCQDSIGAGLVSAHAFLCEMCHENEKSFPFAFIAQASVEMDRYRGLCCWYTSIAIRLLLRSLCMSYVDLVHQP